MTTQAAAAAGFTGSLASGFTELPEVSAIAFDGSTYGQAYIVVGKGDSIRRVPHAEEGSDWTFIRVTRRLTALPAVMGVSPPEQGWYPTLYLEKGKVWSELDR